MRWKRLLLFWFLFIVAGIMMLALLQHRMIYHPRSYGEFYKDWFDSRLYTISYHTSEGRQSAFYWPPDGDTQPEMLWIMFGGNAALALDWMWLVEKASDPGMGFILIDYPGFGECEGSASPETILASSETALEQWTERYAGNRHPQFGIFGHSLGAAAGLQLAEKIPVRKVLLLSPFTSVAEMVRRMFGSWIIPLLRHRFDNIGPLKSLLKREVPPAITIIHGGRDEVIPVEMGHELAAIDPQRIQFYEIPNAHHNTIVKDALDRILKELSVGEEKSNSKAN